MFGKYVAGAESSLQARMTPPALAQQFCRLSQRDGARGSAGRARPDSGGKTAAPVPGGACVPHAREKIHPLSARRGFTLVETLVTIAIYGLVMVAATDLLRTVFMTNSTEDPNALNVVDKAQAAATTFVNQVRDAAYGADGSYPLNEASTSELIFFSPYGSASPTTVDRIRYYLSGSTLYEGVTAPSGSPASYNLSNEKITPVLTGVSGATTTIFYYYGGTYAGTSTPLAQPVNVNQVSYAQIDLSVGIQETRGATTTTLVSTGAAIRNLKTNLGN